MIVIDTPLFPYKGKLYCHLMSDCNNKKELHTFAEKIGVKKCWYELSASGVPHYDLNEQQHKIAIEAGAKHITDRRELAELLIKLSKKKK